MGGAFYESFLEDLTPQDVVCIARYLWLEATHQTWDEVRADPCYKGAQEIAKRLNAPLVNILQGNLPLVAMARLLKQMGEEVEIPEVWTIPPPEMKTR